MIPKEPYTLLIYILIIGLQIFFSTRSKKRWGFILPIGVVMYGLIQIVLTAQYYDVYCQQGGSASLDALILFNVYATLLPVLLLVGVFGISRRVILRK